MLKFGMESPLLMNALEIGENVGFFHTKIGWEPTEPPGLGSKRTVSVQVQHQQGQAFA